MNSANSENDTNTDGESVECMVQGRPTALATLCAGRGALVEFWHVKCPRCPAELLRSNAEAAKHAVPIVAARLSLCEDPAAALEEAEAAVELKEEMGGLPNLVHVHLTFGQKEHAKRVYAFRSVPHHIVLNAKAEVVYGGPDGAVARRCAGLL